MSHVTIACRSLFHTMLLSQKTVLLAKYMNLFFTVEQPRPRRRQRVVLPEVGPDDDDSTWVGAPVTNVIDPEEQDQEEETLNTKVLEKTTVIVQKCISFFFLVFHPKYLHFSSSCKVNEWTDEDFSRLSRAMVKFPGGTPKRWVKIAQELGMTVEMVRSPYQKFSRRFHSNTSNRM